MSTYPNDDDGQALAQIESQGSDMSLPMEIDFFIAVPSSEAGEAVSAVVRPLGFSPSVELDDESGEWTCYAAKTMVATYEAITEAQSQLSRVSEALGGLTDGWGSYGNKPAH